MSSQWNYATYNSGGSQGSAQPYYSHQPAGHDGTSTLEGDPEAQSAVHQAFYLGDVSSPRSDIPISVDLYSHQQPPAHAVPQQQIYSTQPSTAVGALTLASYNVYASQHVNYAPGGANYQLYGGSVTPPTVSTAVPNRPPTPATVTSVSQDYNGSNQNTGHNYDTNTSLESASSSPITERGWVTNPSDSLDSYPEFEVGERVWYVNPINGRASIVVVGGRRHIKGTGWLYDIQYEGSVWTESSIPEESLRQY